MLLTMNTILAGGDGLVLHPGEQHDFAEEEAQQLLAAGCAVAVIAPAAAAADGGDQVRESRTSEPPVGAKVVTPKGGKRGGKGDKPTAAAADGGA